MSTIYQRKSWAWWLLLVIYLGMFAFDLYQNRQVPFAYKLEMPFFLTYVGALHVMLRHFFHYDGAVIRKLRPILCKSKQSECCLQSSWRKLCFTFFYQQIFAVELTIVSCYWLLLSHFFVTTLSIVVMHGLFALFLYVDFFITRVNFKLKLNLFCSCIYALMYMAISWTAQLIFNRPVYPMSDWQHHLLQALGTMFFLWVVTMLANFVAYFLSKNFRKLP